MDELTPQPLCPFEEIVSDGHVVVLLQPEVIELAERIRETMVKDWPSRATIRIIVLLWLGRFASLPPEALASTADAYASALAFRAEVDPYAPDALLSALGGLADRSVVPTVAQVMAIIDVHEVGISAREIDPDHAVWTFWMACARGRGSARRSVVDTIGPTLGAVQ
ncbi:hypothetical protein [Prosthecomicrobium sp. N25]|uniref:hypothetical protein n=1 Tax=Prosthecomicrobium sp. N25 TaxID=3129254 RepID=UPI003076BF83